MATRDFKIGKKLAGIARRPAVVAACSVAALFAPAARSTLALAAPDCGGKCPALQAALKTQLDSERSQTELLQKNRDYLAKLGPDDLSKAIKAKSNILIFVVRLETFKNDISTLRGRLTSLECQRCPGSPR